MRVPSFKTIEIVRPSIYYLKLLIYVYHAMCKSFFPIHTFMEIKQILLNSYSINTFQASLVTSIVIG